MKFELSLSKNYVEDWTLQDAIREFIQNAIDQQNTVQNNDMSITYDREERCLYIKNKKSILEKKTLLLGSSSKSDDEKSIGKFGEGYKIALLVLTRLGKKVTIFNYGAKEVWSARFVKSKKYEGSEVLTIFVDKKYIWESVPNDDLTIKIENISEEDYEEVVERTLFLQNGVEGLGCNRGKILLDPKHKGKIFVNGLFININDSFEYGYDIMPKYLDIGRDRNLTNSCNIQFQTSYMWSEYPDDSRLKEMIKDESFDVEYINHMYESYRKLEKIANEVYEDLIEENVEDIEEENVLFVSSQAEFNNAQKEYSNVLPIIVPKKVQSIIENSDKYQSSKEKLIKKEISKEDKYKIWKDKYSGFFNDKAIEELDALIEELLQK